MIHWRCPPSGLAAWLRRRSSSPPLLSGCAHAPPKADTAAYEAYQQQNDPIEPTNRFFYAVNDRIDRYAFKPVAQGYVDITTQGIRNHVGYFITNIGEPARMVNFMFEGKSRDAGTSLVRFVVNSTVGIGGIFDPATALGYQEQDTDFGMTLAEWGVAARPVSVPAGVRPVRRARCVEHSGGILRHADGTCPGEHRAQ